MKPLNDARILFYVPGMDVINDGVYYSQVFALARYAVSLGAKCMIVYTSSKDVEQNRFSMDGIDIIRCAWDSSYTPLPFLPNKYFRITNGIMEDMFSFAPSHIYVRDPFSGYAGVKIASKLGAKVVFSRRGAGMEKGHHSIKEYLQEFVSKFFVWRILRKSSHVNVVSSYLMQLERRWFKGPMSVLQCCVMSERQQILSGIERVQSRCELGLSPSAPVVAYSGGMSSYQCIDDILRLMKKIHNADNRIEFMFLTKDLELLKKKLVDIGLSSECVYFKSCTPIEVTKYLQAADVAIILRQDDLVNRVASPVKIAEYLASGLGIVVSPWIGDVKRILGVAKCALLMDRATNVQSILDFIYGMNDTKRQEAREIVLRHYTYEGNRQVVLSMFS